MNRRRSSGGRSRGRGRGPQYGTGRGPARAGARRKKKKAKEKQRLENIATPESTDSDDESKAGGAKGDKIVVEGTVTKTLPNAMFRVALDEADSEHEILAHISGRMRKFFIKILPGDQVTIKEVRPISKTKHWCLRKVLSA